MQEKKMSIIVADDEAVQMKLLKSMVLGNFGSSSRSFYPYPNQL
jgi:hypothetical protein